MDDDGGDWFADGGDDAPAETVAAEAEPAAEAGKPAEAAAGDAPAGEQAAEAEKPIAEEDQYLDPDRLLLFKHWIRPKFLQYSYLYNYRHNYYNDVIDFLDKRQKGLNRDIPRPQTWAERALRTYTDKTKKEEVYKRCAQDTKLISNMRMSGAFFHYHTREYLNRRYSSILL